MKKFLLLFVGLQAGIILLNAGTNDSLVAEYSSKANQTTLSFEENKGQVHDQNYQARPDVLFSGQDGDMVFHLKSNGISYQLSRVDSWKDAEDLRTGPLTTSIGMQPRKTPDQITLYRLDLNWVNANTKVLVKPGNCVPSYNNYYSTTCPDGALHVRSYESVTYSNLYSGVDLKWYQKDGHLKYDYIVAPHADYKQIQLQIEGAVSISINAQGELVIETPLGQIIEEAPFVTQGTRKLMSKWVVQNNTVSFSIEGSNPNEELIIDPAVRTWGTYYGGNWYESVYSFCACDAIGNVYLSGGTSSGTAIATSGGHQATFPGGISAYLVKFDNGGVRMWGTYYGSGLETGAACATDGSGNVYLTGSTASSVGVATAGSHQSVFSGFEDAFLVKFDGGGVRQWGTYYGGPGGQTVGWSCTVDGNGDVYMAGMTEVNTGTSIATPGSHQSVHGGDFYDVFLVKFSSSGVRQWGTYYGGIGDDRVGQCIADASGNVYMAGYTSTYVGTAIATIGSHQSTSNDGIWHDAFLVKFNSAGVRQWGTYYGDVEFDVAFSCTVDVNSDVYMSGYSRSWEGIATYGSHQDSLVAIWPNGDGFLAKFNSSGALQWATYYGGSQGAEGESCVTDASGNIFVTGTAGADTGTVIATPGSHQLVHGGGVLDVFLMKFNSAGVRQWGTYYGGAGDDYGYSCAIDASGSVYISGSVDSTSVNGIASVGAHQTTHGGWRDNFLAKFDGCLIPVNVSLSSQTNLDCSGDTNGSATVAASGGSGLTYSWSPSGGTSPTANGLSAGYYTCTVTNSCGNLNTHTVEITEPPLLIPDASSTNILCNGGSAIVIVSASGGVPLYAGTGSFSVVAGTYSYTVTDANGCTSTTTITVMQPPVISTSQTVSICSNDSLIIGSSVYYNSGSYTDVLTAANGCDSTVTTNLTVNPAITSSQTISICSNDSLVVGSNVYYSSGTYNDFLTSANGCDSTVTTNLTVNPAIAASQTIIICSNDSLVVGSSVYYTAGTYTDVLISANGCDSTVTTNLTVNPAASSSQAISLCSGDSIIVGSSVYYSSGTYNDVLTSVNGCDSTVTTNLTVNPAIDVTTTLNIITITANQSAATYQWVDCNNGNQPIAGATSQSFTPVVNGGYAVIVTQSACSDTSACVVILSVGTSSYSTVPTVNVYPNPSTTGDFILKLDRSAAISVTDARGRDVFAATYSAGQHDLHLEELSDGVYFLVLHDALGITTQKLIIGR